MSRLLAMAASFWLLGVGIALAQQPPRLALLVGNQGYTPKVGRLNNPHNDVDIVAASLTRLGFTVAVVKDGTYKEIDTALKRHVTDVRRAGRGAISFFYYSGHGVVNPETQTNYLIPVDVPDADDDKVWFESIQQNVIIDLFAKQAPGATHYLVFDACRNELNVGGANRKALGSDKGFVPVADTSGLLIAYATAPKQTASDAGIGGGPYARALAEELLRPGVEAVGMFRNVQIRVKQSIGQDPWLSLPALPPVYLAGPTALGAASGGPPATLAPDAGASRADEAATAWSIVQASTDRGVLDAFIRRFGDTIFGDLAKRRLASLERPAPPAPQPELITPPTASGLASNESAPRPVERTHRPRPRTPGEDCAVRRTRSGGQTYCVSSVLSSQLGNTYRAGNLFDGARDTAWVEGKNGSGLGEWIVVAFEGERRITGFQIANGYDKQTSTSNLFRRNNRVDALRVVFSSGRSEVLRLRDSPEFIRYNLSTPEAATWVQFVIESVHRGSHYDDTAISELEVLLAGDQ